MQRKRLKEINFSGHHPTLSLHLSYICVESGRRVNNNEKATTVALFKTHPMIGC
jgi:hypothetical protein